MHISTRHAILFSSAPRSGSVQQVMEERAKERLLAEQVIGFRSFLLRGKEKVSLEWTLMSTSYNLK